MKIFFDGGCRPNPGTIEVAVVAGGVVYHEADLGHGGSNDAEWLAAIHALTIARRLGGRDIVLLGDSTTVVEQASGRAPCRTAALAAHHASFEALRGNFDRVRIRYIKRTQNLAGIVMAKRHSGR